LDKEYYRLTICTLQDTITRNKHTSHYRHSIAPTSKTLSAMTTLLLQQRYHGHVADIHLTATINLSIHIYTSTHCTYFYILHNDTADICISLGHRNNSIGSLHTSTLAGSRYLHTHNYGFNSYSYFFLLALLTYFFSLHIYTSFNLSLSIHTIPRHELPEYHITSIHILT
jgi:hypothetical protein